MACFAEFSGFMPLFMGFFISSFLLVLEKTSSVTLSPSPDSPEASGGNPFWAGVRPEKIEADSGKKLLIQIPISLNSKCRDWMGLRLRSA